MKKASVCIFLMVVFASATLFAEAFHLSFFNNGKEKIVKIVASPAGEQMWNVIYTGSMGYGAQKLTFSGKFGNWDIKAITEGGDAFVATLNPAYRQNLSFGEMSPAGKEGSEGASGPTAEYTIRMKNMTGKTINLLLVRPYGSGDFQQIPLNNIAHNGSTNLKFKGKPGVSDWDVAVRAVDGSTFAKENVSLGQIIKFDAEDAINLDDDSSSGESSSEEGDEGE